MGQEWSSEPPIQGRYNTNIPVKKRELPPPSSVVAATTTDERSNLDIPVKKTEDGADGSPPIVGRYNMNIPVKKREVKVRQEGNKGSNEQRHTTSGSSNSSGTSSDTGIGDVVFGVINAKTNYDYSQSQKDDQHHHYDNSDSYSTSYHHHHHQYSGNHDVSWSSNDVGCSGSGDSVGVDVSGGGDGGSLLDLFN